MRLTARALRDLNCRITLDKAIDGGAMDLRVTATAVDVGDEELTVCTLEDISQQKRLAVLTRVFFHDVLNTAGGIHGFAHLLGDELPAKTKFTGPRRTVSSPRKRPACPPRPRGAAPPKGQG